MNVGDIFQVDGTWGTEEITRRRSYAAVEESTTPSGDTVSISQEARELYSKMIHKYDGAAQNRETSKGAPEGGQPLGGGSGGAGESAAELKEKIQALKSQLMALASQAQAAGPGSAAQSQMNALQAQIAALEAQINSMADA